MHYRQKRFVRHKGFVEGVIIRKNPHRKEIRFG